MLKVFISVETYAPAARLEAIHILLAYANFNDIFLYQMDVKSAFLYGKIEEKVYVRQPPVFEHPEYPNKVYRLKKALYGLKQAPRAWYDTLEGLPHPQRASSLAPPTPLYSNALIMVIFSCVTFMWMILSSVALTMLAALSLGERCPTNIRCP